MRLQPAFLILRTCFALAGRFDLIATESIGEIDPYLPTFVAPAGIHIQPAKLADAPPPLAIERVSYRQHEASTVGQDFALNAGATTPVMPVLEGATPD